MFVKKFKKKFLGDLRNDNDPNCTYEGENNVLIQQASNFLLSLRSKSWESFAKASPLGSAGYLKEGEKILSLKWKWDNINDVMWPESKSNLIIKILFIKYIFRPSSMLDLGRYFFTREDICANKIISINITI